jgi:hypothetical protein
MLLGTAASSNNGFYFFYNHNSAAANRYFGFQAIEAGAGTGFNLFASGGVSHGDTTDPGAGAIRATGSETILAATAIPAGGTAGSGYKFSSTPNFGVFFGSGAPTLSAAKGSLYLCSDGSATNNRAYINTDGGTTWTALTTAT